MSRVGISQHKQLAMGMKSTGQEYKKGGSVKRPAAPAKGGRPNPFAKGKK